MIKTFIKGIFLSFLLIVVIAANSYAWGGGPYLDLSTDPNCFWEGGKDYVGQAYGWKNYGYLAQAMPFTMYLYNCAGFNTTAYDIGLIVAVHKGDTSGSITIADAYGAETTLHYSDFTTIDPYPGPNHNIDGVYAVLKPSIITSLTNDWYGCGNTSSLASSWTSFVVKSSSFSEVHFDARSSAGCNTFYNDTCSDVDLKGFCGGGGGGGGGGVPEPASLSFFGFALFGLSKFIKRRSR